jgi:ketosteroid isomerase-like protein
VDRQSTSGSAAAEVATAVDEFHAAASAADEARYFSRITRDFVYLGTAADERWEGDDFRSFVHGFFSQGKGMTYVPSERHVRVGDDGRTAWFDERLTASWCEHCRGTGVAVLQDGEWRIAQYSLSITIPDEIADEVVERIREAASA